MCKIGNDIKLIKINYILERDPKILYRKKDLSLVSELSSEVIYHDSDSPHLIFNI